MARKFGGKYSPDASSRELKVDIEYRGPSVDPAGAKSNVMFVPAIVVAATSLGGGAIHMAMGLGTAALWTLGAWLLRDSLRAEAADTKRGNRPGFSNAASPDEGRALYEYFSDGLAQAGVRVETGEFGADMKVSLINDGPVTIWLDTAEGK